MLTRDQRIARMAVLCGVGALLVSACGPAHHASQTSQPALSSLAVVTSPPPAAAPAAAASPPAASTASSVPASSVPASSAPASPPVSAAAPKPQPAFVELSAAVTAAQLGGSWHAGCPVGPAQLRLLTMSYWGFDNTAHVGTMVVNAAVVSSVFTVFKRLYGERFPIRLMEPTADFGGSDPKSMDADNTSGFNCRYAVAPGKPAWSVHAYGEAIDVDTVENPYLEGGTVQPAAGAMYVKRSPYRPGMAVPGGQLVQAFAAVGWLWGGRWTGSPDFQHFSLTGG